MAIRGEWLRVATAGAIALVALQCNKADAQQFSEIDPIGVDIGGFRLYPDIAVTTYYDDNIFLSPTNPRADGAAAFRPTVVLRSNWSVHQLELDATSTLLRYYANPEQNTDEYEGGAKGRLDFDSRTPISASVRAGRAAQIRGAPGDENSFGRYRLFDFTRATVGASRNFNRLTLSVNGLMESNRYLPIKLAGETIDQRESNRDSKSLSGAVQYAYSNITVPYVSVTYDTIKYPNSVGITARNSSGISFLVGTSFEITRLFYGSIAFGYLKTKFDNALYANFGGLNYSADITYKPTNLDTLHFTAKRSITNSGLIGVPGVLQSNFNFNVVHEWTYRLSVVGNIDFNREIYRGIDRKQDRFDASIGLRRNFNRFLTAGLSYSRMERQSAGSFAAAKYAANRISLSLTAAK